MDPTLKRDIERQQALERRTNAPVSESYSPSVSLKELKEALKTLGKEELEDLGQEITELILERYYPDKEEY